MPSGVNSGSVAAHRGCLAGPAAGDVDDLVGLARVVEGDGPDVMAALLCIDRGIAGGDAGQPGEHNRFGRRHAGHDVVPMCLVARRRSTVVEGPLARDLLGQVRAAGSSWAVLSRSSGCRRCSAPG